MDFLHTINSFFLSEWLWSMTFGIYQIPLAIFFMVFFIRYGAQMRWMPALLLALLANLFSFIVYTMLVVVLLIFIARHEFYPEELHQVPNFGYAVGAYVGLIYTLLQTIFFSIMQRKHSIALWRIILISLLSNLLAAWCVYLFLPTH